jgi:hypothetical protein
MDRQLYAELPRGGMQLATTRLEKAAVFPWIPSVEVQSFAPPPQRLLVKILTRDVTRCLENTHIFLTSNRIKAPGMCVSAI